MDLRQLRYFQAVAEELSFSKAALRLRIAQPALSRAVQELERELGAPLMDRTRRTVRLTPAGAVLMEEAGLLLDRFAESVRKVKRTMSGEEGELRLGYIGPPTQSFLGKVLAEYRRGHPNVSVHLEERTPERVWEMVAKGRLSVGLTRPVLAHESLGLPYILLRKERFCVALPPGHAWAEKATLPWSRLKNEPVVLLARREGVSSHDTIMAACGEADFVPRVAHTPSLIGTVLRYVESGIGIGIVPEGVVSNKLESEVVLIPLKPVRTVPLIMVWNKAAADPPVVAFIELMRSWLTADRLFSGD